MDFQRITNPLKNSLPGACSVSPRPRSRRLSHTALVLAAALLGAGVGGGVTLPSAPAMAQVAPAPVGLAARSEDGNTASLPLLTESLAIRIDGEHAATTYTHVFQNESQARLEGNYHIVVGEGASATGFAYWNGEEKIVGEVFEREAARQVYEAMTGLRRDPGLLEQTGEGAFAFRVFPIEPGEKKKVEVTTSHWLQRRGDAVEVRARISKSDATVTIDLNDARGLKSLTSTTHELRVVQSSPTHWTATVTAKKPGSDGDLVLSYEPNAGPWTLAADVHRDAGQAAFFSASLSTPPRTTTTPKVGNDVTLVLDRSGSMAGESMDSAKKAAAAIVDKLGPDDSVNVIAFDDKIEPLWPTPKPITEATRKDAKDYIATLDARGGTEIAAALKKALSSQKSDAHPDVVLFLTDGQSDGPSAIKVAEDDKSETRVFTVGIGTGVDKALLARLAQMKHGRFNFIADVRAVAVEFPRVLGELEEPSLTDVTIRAEGGTIDRMYPSALGDLFPQDELRVFGRANAAGPMKLIVEGKDHGVARHFETTIDPSHDSTAPQVARAWAGSRVEDLMEDMRQKGETDDLKNEAIELGLAYELVTPYTSFLAVPEKEMTEAAKTAVGSMRAKRQAILAAHKDAAALSRMSMPPGDPVLKVTAPKDAKRVTAFFPFGLVSDLAWDDFSEAWMTRFLVPKDVADGDYDVRVLVVGADGTVTTSSVRFTIDSKSPAMQIDAKPKGAGAIVRVMLDESADEVRIADADDTSNRAVLGATDDRTFEGFLPLEAGTHRIRVVVADRAHNESERIVTVSVP